MEVTIKGVGARGEKAQLEAAVHFFAAKLMDPRMVRNLMIDIEVHKDFDVQGECVDEDGWKNPRWFTIGLRKQDLGEMIKTLGHEMVHVKQHAKNELQHGNMVLARGGLVMRSRWMGELWKPKRKEDAYFDSPWEIEAYGREVGLYQKWIEHNEQISNQ